MGLKMNKISKKHYFNFLRCWINTEKRGHPLTERGNRMVAAAWKTSAGDVEIAKRIIARKVERQFNEDIDCDLESVFVIRDEEFPLIAEAMMEAMVTLAQERQRPT